MQHKNLIDLLSRQGLGKDGDAWTVPNGLAATLYLALDDEALIIDRVVRFELHGECGIATTGRRERYAFELDTVRALRFVADK
jgi:hypothetical protein